MQLGIFAKSFARPTVEECFDAVKSHGLSCVQFNMSCAGLPPLPDAIDPALCDRIANAATSRGLTIAAVSGTFNMIHPDPAVRADGLRRLATLAAACERLGTRVITLCTGTRDSDDMWRRHPLNCSDSAWEDLVTSMKAAIAIANRYGLTLAFEPEVGNVVDSVGKAQRLIDLLGGPHRTLHVVFDPANLFFPGTVARMADVLDEASTRLGAVIAIAHAKDISPDGASHPPAGRGVLDYDRFLAILKLNCFDGPLILHGLPETAVAASVAFLRERMAASSLEETR